jgi:hypothetical protein
MPLKDLMGRCNTYRASELERRLIMKKNVQILLILIITVLCLTACGGADGATGSGLQGDKTVVWDKNVLELYPTTNATGSIAELKNQQVNSGMCQSAQADAQKMTITFYMTTKQYEEYMQAKKDELKGTLIRGVSDYSDEIISAKMNDKYDSLEIVIAAENLPEGKEKIDADIFEKDTALNIIRNYVGLYLAYVNQESCTMIITDSKTAEKLYAYTVTPDDSVYNKDNAVVPKTK